MISRKSAFSLTKVEQDAYVDGVKAMNAAGEYVKFVNIHLDMSHNMHTMRMTGMVGTRRFLPWHRDYLFQMETKLRTFKPAAFVPYWDWTAGGVPPWLSSFTPTVTGVVDPAGNIPPTVTNARTSFTTAVSNAARITTLLGITDYDTFTRELELDPHNLGHRSLGFPMTSLASPCDPIFWMHHAMVDRVWSLWQVKNPGKSAILTGTDAQMDPWMTTNDTVSGLDSIKKLGYEYI